MSRENKHFEYVGANLPPSPLAEALLRPGYGAQVGVRPFYPGHPLIGLPLIS
jgi:hypothetical protein